MCAGGISNDCSSGYKLQLIVYKIVLERRGFKQWELCVPAAAVQRGG